MANAGYSLIAPFFPEELGPKGVSDTVVGIIIGIMAAGRGVGSLSSGLFLHRIRTKIGMGVGLMTIGICVALLGILDYMSSPTLIATAALTLRIIQGLVVGVVLTLCFGTLANDYPERKDQLIALNALFAGIG